MAYITPIHPPYASMHVRRLRQLLRQRLRLLQLLRQHLCGRQGARFGLDARGALRSQLRGQPRRGISCAAR